MITKAQMMSDETTSETNGQAGTALRPGPDRFLRQSKILSQLQQELTEVEAPLGADNAPSPEMAEDETASPPAKRPGARLLWVIAVGVAAAAVVAIGSVVASVGADEALPEAAKPTSVSESTAAGSASPTASVSPVQDPDALPLIVNRVPPTVVGAGSGSVLSVDFGSWEPMPTTANIQWYVNGSAVEGANQRTFALRAGDKGQEVHVWVKAKRAGYEPVEMTSARVKIPG